MKRIAFLAAMLSVVALISCGKKSNDSSTSGVETSQTSVDVCSDSMIIAEHVSKVNPQVKAEFDSIHTAWYEAIANTPEVAVSSNMSTYTTLPQYGQMVEMGTEILPLAVDKMTDERYFFTQLVYEALCPEDKAKLDSARILSGQERAKRDVKMWVDRQK